MKTVNTALFIEVLTYIRFGKFDAENLEIVWRKFGYETLENATNHCFILQQKCPK
jgi:hypothetical protein